MGSTSQIKDHSSPAETPHPRLDLRMPHPNQHQNNPKHLAFCFVLQEHFWRVKTQNSHSDRYFIGPIDQGFEYFDAKEGHLYMIVPFVRDPFPK